MSTRYARTRIKFCGFTRPEDVEQAVSLGVDALGFVMWPKSSRGISPETLATLSAHVPAFATRVGLFVNQPAELIEQCLPYLDVIQFHGDEPASFCQQFDRPWIKALRMRDGIDLHRAADEYVQAQALLLDAYRPGTPGGTGETFDWSRIPAALEKPVILAGGLTAANIAAAVNQVAPYAVDVSGGIEASHGVKDVELMASFVKQVALADAQ
ncbi:phosphoribosylanthranilate isomerase [Halomonas sp. GFAJ-1]|uniref:phosphoribosylanthranilate isomerase n=1 Tax=Halomonas sp. GFAJ-1 TaxID=1118153 RepID=UPI00023A3357|nr:phosphoribosylanthranilate isomerase [Halomonas sp. GFAJ-1]AVI63677.1 N-(5'-phosphoribosyl)anthranilate isomerase [Halomonas sp. GFAJ-1]EHK62129.1 N-(5'-phosphoribosyl)anthranilate isomerase [Halomonas sp. GFAJ-1]